MLAPGGMTVMAPPAGPRGLLLGKTRSCTHRQVLQARSAWGGMCPPTTSKPTSRHQLPLLLHSRVRDHEAQTCPARAMLDWFAQPASVTV